MRSRYSLDNEVKIIIYMLGLAALAALAEMLQRFSWGKVRRSHIRSSSLDIQVIVRIVLATGSNYLKDEINCTLIDEFSVVSCLEFSGL